MMFLISATVALTLLVTYVGFSTAYVVVLALASLLIKDPPRVAPDRLRRFAILIPAHNEEILMARLLDSILAVRYPLELREIFVIADNCSDKTSEIVQTYPVTLLARTDECRVGKGFAIKHALDNIGITSFDAILIIDADNIVDEEILTELNHSLASGQKAIQCQNAVGNRDDSWFAELLCISRTISNRLYHHGKHKLGLSSYLMGNGICFSTDLLQKLPWTAYSLGEDWEYYAMLARSRISVGFAVNAKVFHQESKSLEQATSQRLRWAKGRFDMGKKFALRLLAEGLRKRDWRMADASLPFILPNYSLQVNLTLLALLLCLLLPSSALRSILLSLGLASLLCQAGLFVVGMILAGNFRRSLVALVRAPLFLAWKSVIDLVTITGIYRGGKWIRTKRHSPVVGRPVIR